MTYPGPLHIIERECDCFIVPAAHMNTHKLVQRKNMPGEGQRPQEGESNGPGKGTLPNLFFNLKTKFK